MGVTLVEVLEFLLGVCIGIMLVPTLMKVMGWLGWPGKERGE